MRFSWKLYLILLISFLAGVTGSAATILYLLNKEKVEHQKLHKAKEIVRAQQIINVYKKEVKNVAQFLCYRTRFISIDSFAYFTNYNVRFVAYIAKDKNPLLIYPYDAISFLKEEDFLKNLELGWNSYDNIIAYVCELSSGDGFILAAISKDDLMKEIREEISDIFLIKESSKSADIFDKDLGISLIVMPTESLYNKQVIGYLVLIICIMGFPIFIIALAFADKITNPIHELENLLKEKAQKLKLSISNNKKTSDEIERIFELTKIFIKNLEDKYQETEYLKDIYSKQKQLLEHLINKFPDPTFLVDENDRKIIFMNEAMVNSFNLSQKENVFCYQIFGYQNICPWCPDWKEGKTEQREFCIIDKRKTYSMKYIFFRDLETNDPLRLVLISDRSEYYDYQARMIASEHLRAIGEMASGVAHDLNNLLMILESQIYFLSQVVHDEKLKLRINNLSDIVIKGREILTRLQKLSKKRYESPQPVNLQKVVEDVIKITKPKWYNEALHKGIEIKINTNVPPLWVLCTESNLIEIFINLIFNAVDAMPNGGAIYITAKEINNFVEIVVRDTGIGMDEETAKRVFDPFFTTKKEGTGLGLAMTKNIIQAYNGKISIVSKIGEGTSVIINLPKATPSEREQIALKPYYIKQKRALIVEDEEIIADLLGDILKEMGFDVHIEYSLDSAKEKLKQQKFDVIVTDLGLPGGSGWEIVELARKENPDCKIIISSGFFGAEDDERMKKFQVNDFIRKPFSIAEFQQKIQMLFHELKS